ncbi:acetyltransferase [Hydrogenophaga crassostreae]|uniref:Acetyltransferase n=1 Tax=Hydrogenophaga crassostreae TaxID=1763535 RepID=A0A170AKX7_9BURK|nr:GNAT family N-acetyltransferase [Hydrogenophaga crassostreae]AOW13827.1 GNAT family N-acetyltransferase [Hydrogenophaga crassostreae]OAD44209.1 acetyltransferase [Hydrogenophaga crassostreae]
MTGSATFTPYSPTDKLACLGLFDANCPAFFAPNERLDYEGFLDGNPLNYELCLIDGRIAGAFGLMGDGLQAKSLNWILLDPGSHGKGIGSAIMMRITDGGRASGVSLVTIAASHKSAPFFAKFGAAERSTIEDGWGPGMHRIDMELRI